MKSLQPLSDVKNIIAVASGKGGVGKSTTAVNLALALQIEGHRVGILDADIYGPSQPTMLGVSKRPEMNEKKMLPIISHGLQSMSIGYLVDDKAAMVWRGPMVTMALQQLLYDTEWDNLDYLIVDLPPGTGDIQLTLAQKIPVTGAVLVTTPQDLALVDVRRAFEMFQKVNVTTLGIIENMSQHICTQCGHEEFIFGSGGADLFAKQFGIDFLGSLPLDIKIREETDSGVPTVVRNPDSPISLIYRDMAKKIVAKLVQDTQIKAIFPKIEIRND